MLGTEQIKLGRNLKVVGCNSLHMDMISMTLVKRTLSQGQFSSSFLKKLGKKYNYTPARGNDC